MTGRTEDEFRVEVDLDDREHGFSLSERLHALDLDDEVTERLGSRVIVTRDGSKLYVYTQTAAAAGEAERAVRGVLDAEGLTADTRRRRWNPAEGFWQDADEPLASEGMPGPDYAREAEDEGIRKPLFVYIEGHRPEFMRDLGL